MSYCELLWDIFLKLAGLTVWSPRPFEVNKVLEMYKMYNKIYNIREFRHIINTFSFKDLQKLPVAKIKYLTRTVYLLKHTRKEFIKKENQSFAYTKQIQKITRIRGGRTGGVGGHELFRIF